MEVEAEAEASPFMITSAFSSSKEVGAALALALATSRSKRSIGGAGEAAGRTPGKGFPSLSSRKVTSGSKTLGVKVRRADGEGGRPL